MSDLQATARATKQAIVRLGGGFMISREAKAYGERLGLPGWTPYMRGRCGVLGDVDADVVTAAVGFFHPATVRTAWEAGGAVPAAEAAHRYAGACQDYGRRKLAGFGGADRLAELIEPVVRHADVTAAPLFAGWRALPLPADGPARAQQLTHVLRELRGGCHLAAVLATGSTPLQSVLCGGAYPISDGPGNARYFGWPDPFEEVTEEMRDRRARAEELTDALTAPAFAALTEAERDELIDLLDKAFATAFS